MDDILRELAGNMVTMTVGGIGTALVWSAKAIFKAKRDLDSAHQKIRFLVRRVDEIEEQLHFGE